MSFFIKKNHHLLHLLAHRRGDYSPRLSRVAQKLRFSRKRCDPRFCPRLPCTRLLACTVPHCFAMLILYRLHILVFYSCIKMIFTRNISTTICTICTDGLKYQKQITIHRCICIIVILNFFYMFSK